MSLVTAEVIERLRAAVSGDLVAEGDTSYAEARVVWNGMVAARPAAVVRAASVGDVASVVKEAVASDIQLAIRGGGHNVAGNGTVDGGIVLDLRALQDVRVDPARRAVRVGPGATLADVDRVTQQHGLVVPLGVVSRTGVAGLTLGGGVGWLTRRYGLSIDALHSAEVLTAAGETLRASADEHPDLFWALRGGGGNFGVVTAFEFRAHPLGPAVSAGNLVYGRPRWREALLAYAQWTRELPDALTSIITFLVPPPDWELGDEAVMLVGWAWAGQAEDPEPTTIVDRLRSTVAPDAEIADPTTWVAWQSQADGLFPTGVRAYWKNAALGPLSPQAIDAIVEHAGRLEAVGTAADLHHMEGAFGRVPEEETAFPNRRASYWLNLYGFWRDPGEDAQRSRWVRDFHAAVEPYALPGQYVNFLGDEGPGSVPRMRAEAAYGPEKLRRLVEVSAGTTRPTCFDATTTSTRPGRSEPVEGGQSCEPAASTVGVRDRHGDRLARPPRPAFDSMTSSQSSIVGVGGTGQWPVASGSAGPMGWSSSVRGSTNRAIAPPSEPTSIHCPRTPRHSSDTNSDGR
jgi:FAD/FMN-containing dehydrogenase